jgi:hypothetical protein
MKEYSYFLKYGRSTKENLKKFPLLYIYDDSSCSYKQLTLTRISNDCGSIWLSYCQSATKEKIQTVLDICSFNGFDKVFHTLITDDEDTYNKTTEILEELGFICTHKGRSNRNPHKLQGVFIYINNDCDFKGYMNTPTDRENYLKYKGK